MESPDHFNPDRAADWNYAPDQRALFEAARAWRKAHDIAPAADWRPILKQLHRNVVPVIVSFEVPKEMQGLVKLYDMERKRRQLTWFSQRRIGDVNREERERVANLIRSFRSAGLDYMLVSSQFQIYPQLARLARMRRQRKH